jgi:hypothetical protein
MLDYVINLSAQLTRQDRDILNSLLLQALNSKPTKGLYKISKQALLNEIPDRKQGLESILNRIRKVDIRWQKRVEADIWISSPLIQYFEIGKDHVNYRFSKEFLTAIVDPSFFGILQGQINRGLKG